MYINTLGIYSFFRSTNDFLVDFFLYLHYNSYKKISEVKSMTDEELKQMIETIIDENIWFDEGDAFHYDYDDLMKEFLELFHRYKNS